MIPRLYSGIKTTHGVTTVESHLLGVWREQKQKQASLTFHQGVSWPYVLERPSLRVPTRALRSLCTPPPPLEECLRWVVKVAERWQDCNF